MRIIGFIFIFMTLIFANDDAKYVLKVLKEIQNFHIKFKILKDPLNAFFLKKINKVNFSRINTLPQFSKSDTVLHLEAIIFNKALINNIWVKKGDEIYGYKVIAIKRNEVILLKNGKKFVLKMRINLLKVKK